MNTIVVKASHKTTKALISIFEAFGVSFEVKNEQQTQEETYDKAFVDMVLKASKEEGEILTSDYKRELFQNL